MKMVIAKLTVAIIWFPTTICGIDASSCTASAASLANSSLQNSTFCAASSFCCQCCSTPSPGMVPGQFSAEELSVMETTSSCSKDYKGGIGFYLFYPDKVIDNRCLWRQESYYSYVKHRLARLPYR